MEVSQEYYGLPPPPVGFGQPLHLSIGDIIELTKADADLAWWEVGHTHAWHCSDRFTCGRSNRVTQTSWCLCATQGRNLTVGQMGWFPYQKVQPYVPVSNVLNECE